VRNVILANVFIKWAWYARMIRTNVLKYKDKNYILYSKSIGNTTPYIIVKHLIPAISSELAVLATLDMGWAILNISPLSFLGLGVKFPFASWGNIINDVNNTYVLSNYLFIWIPAGVCLLLTVLAFNLVGDGLRDAFDPKMKR